MALTQSQVSALYIALLGRASEGEGSKYWLNTSKSANLSMADVARFIMNDKEAKANFASHFETPEKLVDFIYANAFGKGAGVDQEGKAFWINHLKNGVDQATIVSEILKGALAEKYAKSTDATIKNDFSLFINKIAASNMVSETVEKLPEGGVKALQEINKAVKPATKVAEVKNLITANEALKSAVDTTKLEKAATANDPAKVIANVTGAKAEEITKILKENPVVSTNDSGSSSQGSSDTGSSNSSSDSGSGSGSSSGGSSSGGSSSGGTASGGSSSTPAATEVSAESDGFYKLFGDSKPQVKLELDGDKLFKKGAELFKAANVDSIGSSAETTLPVLKIKGISDSANLVLEFNAKKDVAITTLNVASFNKAAALALLDDGSSETFKSATGLAAGDVDVAKKADSFTMHASEKLTVEAADVEALKTKAGDGVLAVSDTAAGIESALGNLVTNVAKVASIAANDSNTITVDARQLTALKGKVSDNALDVEGKGTELKTTLVGLIDSELAKIKNASIDLKGETGDDNGEIELTLTEFSKLGTKFSGTTGTDTITVTGVTAGEVAASAAKDVFKLGAGATGLNITGFAHNTDKVNVKAIAGEASGFEAATATNAGVKMAIDKAYYVDGSAIDTSGLGDSFNATTTADFGKLFAANDTAFKTTVEGATATALLAVKVDADTIQLYTINSAKSGTATDITATDLTLVGSVTGAAAIDSSAFLF